VLILPANYPVGRATETEAIRILEKSGYLVVRASNPAPFDLIAWKDPADILCVVVRRSKSVCISGYSKQVSALSKLVEEGKAPGKCQFWIKCLSMWKRYQILPGGTLPIEERRYDRAQVCT